MISRKIVLKFPPNSIDQPLVYKLSKDYDLEFNILKAYITPREEGLLVLELKGKDANYKKGIEFLENTGLEIQPLSQDIIRNEDRCVHCGACVTICPSDALMVDPESREVIFYHDKCIACELCVLACPPRAMEVHFNGG